jgi:hypothetical protein
LLLYSSHLPLGVPNGLDFQLGTNSFLAPSSQQSTFCVLVMIREPDENLLCKGIKAENSFLSLYPKKFDYSLGGYYHRERRERTRRYQVIKEAAKSFEPILKTCF